MTRPPCSYPRKMEYQAYPELRRIVGDFHREIRTPFGIADAISEAFVIEVKQVKNWKWAVGQVMVYSIPYPQKQKAIFLFGSVPETPFQLIKDACESLGITVWFDDELFGQCPHQLKKLLPMEWR